jgi:hypothetical protein
MKNWRHIKNIQTTVLYKQVPNYMYQKLKKESFGDTSEEIHDTQMWRDTMAENPLFRVIRLPEWLGNNNLPRYLGSRYLKL